MIGRHDVHMSPTGDGRWGWDSAARSSPAANTDLFTLPSADFKEVKELSRCHRVERAALENVRNRLVPAIKGGAAEIRRRDSPLCRRKFARTRVRVSRHHATGPGRPTMEV
jgi:hypothetical protein